MLLDTIFIDILFFDSPIKNHSRWMETRIMMKKGLESLFILYRTSPPPIFEVDTNDNSLFSRKVINSLTFLKK